jgi:hypothetical protein
MDRYEIRLAHPFDEVAAAAFDGLDVTEDCGVTVIVGDFDQAALHGLLERVRVWQLELIDVRRVDP